jgi:nitrile hydratase accessory protein
VNYAPGSFTGRLRDDGSPVFREPWEAEAFAITLSLHQRGFITWSEWAESLAAQIGTAQAAGDADLGDSYYRHWLAALEGPVAAKGASSIEELIRYQRAWAHAADRTPGVLRRSAHAATGKQLLSGQPVGVV